MDWTKFSFVVVVSLTLLVGLSFYHDPSFDQTDISGIELRRRTPSIAIIICTTSRGLSPSTLDSMVLFRSLLPSIVNTSESGFTYNIYLVFDLDDAFFNKPETRTQIMNWYSSHMRTPLSRRGIQSNFSLLTFDNREHKPGPAFNYALYMAYQFPETQYFYRINDDSVMLTPWAHILTSRLQSFGWPYGAVGPTCNEGNTRILTHDMTHRTHLDIFPTYYPTIFSDWWMDNWISQVYGRARTARLSEVLIEHRTGEVKTRYEIDYEHRHQLHGEIQLGRNLIEQAMVKRGLAPAIIDAYRKDNFTHTIDPL